MPGTMVIAADEQGNQVAIGPVHTAQRREEIRRQIDDYGWTVVREVPWWNRVEWANARTSGTPVVTQPVRPAGGAANRGAGGHISGNGLWSYPAA